MRPGANYPLMAALHLSIRLPFSPSSRSSSETLGDRRSISRRLSLTLHLNFHLQPTTCPGSGGAGREEKNTTQTRGEERRGGGVGELECILQVHFYHQMDIWIPTETRSVIISISAHVS